ncbi:MULTISPECIES: hypothetical protein [unclassified Streptomyces]|nr:hypothetical protein [Streptomyces sp. CB02980]MCB8902078.1 hypothetical protein [Streptomyces sp. CB02980]
MTGAGSLLSIGGALYLTARRRRRATERTVD